MNKEYHIPVLLQESVDGLDIQPDGVYADLTFGGGGHSSEILKRLSSKGRLLSFDQDKDAVKNAFQSDNFQMVYGNFSYLKNFLKYYKAYPLDGILADLGVSSHHFNEEDRGFSYRFDAPLDMRMNTEGRLTAQNVINEYDEAHLREIFFLYGEIKNNRVLTQNILKYRAEQTIETTSQLCEIAEQSAPKFQENKYLSKVFQALRIEVNQELEVLKQMLLQTVGALKPGGRLVIITYHSLEDRLVKNFIKKGKFSGQIEKDFYGKVSRPFTEWNRKVIVPTDEEIKENVRARSAKLRIAVRTNDPE